MHVDANVNLNEQIVHAIGQKKSKDKINQKYLWHHGLGHIREDRINKLKKDGILSSLYLEPYPACESYLRRKMIKLSFVGHGERATSYLPWYTLMYVGHLMCRSEVVIVTSLSLPMIYIGMGTCI